MTGRKILDDKRPFESLRLFKYAPIVMHNIVSLYQNPYFLKIRYVELYLEMHSFFYMNYAFDLHFPECYNFLYCSMLQIIDTDL